ncbi:hypothetical protein [Paracoccus sp. NSM]|uniref:hypothetical protein n=1 Tax=Paracoccus sp. NSM TaxID=3457784 RepID=UPI0040354008
MSGKEMGIAGIGRRAILLGCVTVPGAALATGPSVGQDAPQVGGTLRIAQTADIQPNAILAGRGGNNAFRRNVVDSLTVLDAETGQPRGVLATDCKAAMTAGPSPCGSATMSPSIRAVR